MVVHLFGNQLKELRVNKKITQEDFGDAFGVSKGTISSWESGRTQPPIETIKEIAQYFGVSTDYLLGFTQEDADSIERLKTVLKEAGWWDYDIDDMSKEDFEKAMQIVTMLKDKKDTNE